MSTKENKKNERLGLTGYNKQGCLMKIIEYNCSTDIIVEFQDEYKAHVHTRFDHFQEKAVRNPYYPSVYGIGIIGDNGYNTNNSYEYQTWHDIFRRCYDPKYHTNKPSYISCEVCENWRFYKNFYEWIISQSNYYCLKDANDCRVDKDILIKGNKIYSPDTCCLVPGVVNSLFVKADRNRGAYPIGVSKIHKDSDLFQARCNNPFSRETISIGIYNTPEDAFYAYKNYKENIIKQVAINEYKKGTITKQCYDAMMTYEVEITD